MVAKPLIAKPYGWGYRYQFGDSVFAVQCMEYVKTPSTAKDTPLMYRTHLITSAGCSVTII